MNLEGLSKGERFIVDWQYNLAGSFHILLARAISIADTHNLASLHLGFPDEVEAFVAYSTEDSWWWNLQKKIGVK